MQATCFDSLQPFFSPYPSVRITIIDLPFAYCKNYWDYTCEGLWTHKEKYSMNAKYHKLLRFMFDYMGSILGFVELHPFLGSPLLLTHHHHHHHCTCTQRPGLQGLGILQSGGRGIRWLLSEEENAQTGPPWAEAEAHKEQIRMPP